MDIKIPASWKEVLTDEFNKQYFQDLMTFVKSEYTATDCYPPGREIFAAFEKCPFDNVRVVIIGQDPYHGYGQAHGLCFSVNAGVSHPPSLRNIFSEIRQDISKSVPVSGDLHRWAAQGVLLLNAVLTVRTGEAGSHQNKGWELFTNAVIEKISNDKTNVVFMLWGGYAKKKGSVVDKSKHLVLESGHPSPLSANKGHWFGNKHFSAANAYLKAKGENEIDW